MLVWAQAGKARAARDFWGRPEKKKSKIATGSWRGAAQAIDGAIVGLEDQQYCQ
jgi:hypothetical protein